MPARVLVIAAQPAVQLQLGNTLRRDGHEILVANDGTEGLRRWGNDRPDLIALDAELPDISGFDIVARIRGSEATVTHTPIVLVGPSNDVDTKVRALRAGADDYLSKPVHPQELSARVRGLLARFARAPQPARTQSFGRVHAYYGAKGGVGTTTLAINTAIALHTELKRTVALVDANLQFGDHRVFLDMGPDQRSIIDAVGATSIDADVLRRVLVRHDSGIDLLLAPPTPEAAEMVNHDQHQLLRIVEVLRTMYDYVIVDMDKRLDDNMLDIVGAADRLVVIMTADLSCLKNVRLVLETMGSLGIIDERLLLVLNRSNAFTGISVKSVESVLKRPIAQQIGNDYRSAISSLNSGTPFMVNRPDSALGRGVSEFARMIDQQTTSAVEEGGRYEMVPSRA
ncbi:MAG: response regulator [Chloroflexota bacterium]